jgi:hypothetical protein
MCVSCIATFFFILTSLVKTDSQHTVGVEFGSKTIEANGKMIKQQIWVIISSLNMLSLSQLLPTIAHFIRIPPVKNDFDLLLEVIIEMQLDVFLFMILQGIQIFFSL